MKITAERAASPWGGGRAGGNKHSHLGNKTQHSAQPLGERCCRTAPRAGHEGGGLGDLLHDVATVRRGEAHAGERDLDQSHPLVQQRHGASPGLGGGVWVLNIGSSAWNDLPGCDGEVVWVRMSDRASDLR